ncbi:MAG: hypothetical protein JNK05_40035 [Myxococcales bacterium]|nr:hypothetical protein [Myxococcales bacterium]
MELEQLAATRSGLTAALFGALLSAGCASTQSVEGRGARAGRERAPRVEGDFRAFGMRFSRTSEWRAPRADDPSRLVGSDGRFFAVTSDPADDRAAHERNVETFRARAAREGWSFGELALPPGLARDDLSFELRIPARVTAVRAVSAALAIDGRLHIVTCSFALQFQSRFDSVCQSVLDGVSRAPLAASAAGAGRVVEEGSLALVLPGDFRESRNHGARVFTSTSRDGGQSAQVAVTIAVGPAADRVERADPATLRRRFEARGAVVRSAAERTLQGTTAALIESEQRVEEQAAVRELVLYVHHQQRSVLAACAVREGDQRGYAACQRIVRSARRE